jgi:hypothetical protein
MRVSGNGVSKTNHVLIIITPLHSLSLSEWLKGKASDLSDRITLLLFVHMTFLFHLLFYYHFLSVVFLSTHLLTGPHKPDGQLSTALHSFSLSEWRTGKASDLSDRMTLLLVHMTFLFHLLFYYHFLSVPFLSTHLLTRPHKPDGQLSTAWEPSETR